MEEQKIGEMLKRASEYMSNRFIVKFSDDRINDTFVTSCILPSKSAISANFQYIYISLLFETEDTLKDLMTTQQPLDIDVNILDRQGNVVKSYQYKQCTLFQYGLGKLHYDENNILNWNTTFYIPKYNTNKENINNI